MFAFGFFVADAVAGSIDFETPSSLEKLTQTGAETDQWSRHPSEGMGGSGALVPPGLKSAANWLISREPFPSNSPKLTASICFRLSEPTLESDFFVVALGVAASSTYAPDLGIAPFTGQNHYAGILQSANKGGVRTYRVRAEAYNEEAQASNAALSKPSALTMNSWYCLKITARKNLPVYTLDVELYPVEGTAIGAAPLMSVSLASFSVPALGALDKNYVFFGVNRGAAIERGVMAIDQFAFSNGN